MVTCYLSNPGTSDSEFNFTKKLSHVKFISPGSLNFFFKNRRNNLKHCVLGVRDIGLRLAKQDLEKAFKQIDKDNSGSINFDEFLVKIRGDTLNKKRTALVERAFKKLDQNDNGTIEIDDLKVCSQTLLISYLGLF